MAQPTTHYLVFTIPASGMVSSSGSISGQNVIALDVPTLDATAIVIQASLNNGPFRDVTSQTLVVQPLIGSWPNSFPWGNIILTAGPLGTGSLAVLAGLDTIRFSVANPQTRARVFTLQVSG